MGKVKEAYLDVLELLEDSENTPLIISKKLNLPVEFVLEIMSTLQDDYLE
jgi:hypothetical protein